MTNSRSKNNHSKHFGHDDNSSDSKLSRFNLGFEYDISWSDAKKTTK